MKLHHQQILCTLTHYFTTIRKEVTLAVASIQRRWLLSYPTAQGLEYFPAGINTGNAIAFSNTDLTKDVITGLATVTYADNTLQTTAYNPTLLGQLAAPNVWTSTTPNQFTASLKFSTSGATQTVPYTAALVGQLSAGNIWSNTTTPNKFVAGIQFNDLTVQTTAATSPATLLSSNNTWTGTNTISLIPSTLSTSAPTAQQFVTQSYGGLTYARLATNNLFSGNNTFERISATACSCADFTSNTLTCTASIDTPTLTATNATITGTLTRNTVYDYFGTSTYQYSQGYFMNSSNIPSLYWGAPNITNSERFVFNFPAQNTYFYIDGAGINYVKNGQPNASFTMTADDVIIRGTSWNETVATLNYLKSFLFKNQTIPP